MPQMSIMEACKHYGLNRATVYTAMGDGRLTYSLLPNGRRALEPAEVERAFPSNRPGQSKQDENRQSETTDLHAVLKEQNHLLMDMLRQSEMDKADLRKRLDESEQERRMTLRLLEDKRSRGSWWTRLIGKAA